MKSLKLASGMVRMIRNHKPGRLVLSTILTLLQGISSGFSVLMLIPMLQLLNPNNSGPEEGIASVLNKMAQNAGFTITIGSILVVFVIILTVNALIEYFKSLNDAIYRQTFIYSLRKRIFNKIINADWNHLNTKSSSGYMQILTREIPAMADFLYHLLRLITTIIISGAYIAYALLISPLFTIIVVFSGLVIFIVLRNYLSASSEIGKGSMESYYRLLKYIDDFWKTIKIAKVHSSEHYYSSKFEEASSSLLDLEFRMHKNYTLPQLFYRISGIVVLAVILFVGYSTGKIPLASFFVLIILFSRIFPQMVSLNTDLNMLAAGGASAALIIDLDDSLIETVEEPAEQKPFPALKDSLVLKEICFRWPSGEVLFDKFTATVPSGKITGITGMSGIGKTTLIDIIAGLQKPDEGRILADGVSIEEKQLSAWKKGIGYLPQDPFFVDGTIRENLLWDTGRPVTDEEIMGILEQVNTIHLVNRLNNGIDTPVTNYQFAFSGGELQRIALARVLLRKPSLLLLDEATSSLDAENEEQIMKVISGLRGSVTVIFVTHRDSVAKWFDNIIKI